MQEKNIWLLVISMTVFVVAGCNNDKAEDVFAPVSGSSKSTKYVPIIKDVPVVKEKADTEKK